MSFSFIYGLILLAGFILALLFTPLSRAIALSTGFIDYPKEDRVHRRPTPFLGGVAVAFAAALASGIILSLVPLPGAWTAAVLPRWAVATLLFSSALALTLGLVDDRLELNPLQKLSGQILISVIFLWPSLSLGFPNLLLWPVALLWLVGLQNAFNLLDNMDGVLSGIATLIGLFLGGAALLLGRPDLAAIAFAGGGACLGFLCFNFPPASIFLGDAGAFFIGFLMAGVGWDLVGDQCLSFTSATAGVLLVLSYPIFDVTFVTVTRSLERRPIHVGGIDHTTHRLHAILGRNRRALWTVYSLVGLSGLAGLVAVRTDPIVAWSLVVLAACLYTGLGVMLARVPVRSARFLSTFLGSDEASAKREVA
ncbi:MAG TPA: MraY family glycosyltransferase [Dongiaceae bacterium]|nr:MraY family glycosyltransferase [Dongiaceae bacterium]